MDMAHALEKLSTDFPDTEFKEFWQFEPNTYGLTATGKNFQFVIGSQPSPMCLYVRTKMCCQAMK